ncbi:MAG TPA: Gfo/Idh/MocA family oxidoreductase [Chloroflexota bacterium]
MTGRIRVGIVGATVTRGGSGWGANAHVPALRALPTYELKAVCTAHEETARASAEAFGAPLAFSSYDAMVASPDIDMVVVCVRVPGHYELVMKALQAGKSVLCEWPLGATLAQAEQMAALAAEKSLATAVGLQARSDATLTYARDLVQQGYIGEVVAANMTALSQTISERGAGRIWQGKRENGANTLTIAAGHAIDALCFVLGEFQDVSAQLATTTTRWHNPDTDETLAVDSPDWIGLTGHLQRGTQVAALVATVPANPSGHRFEIYGREGTLVISGGSLNGGPNRLQGSRGTEALTPMEAPERYTLVPASTPTGSPRNVAQAYVRFASARASGETYQPDFAHAVARHRLIAAIERSAADGVRVPATG